MILSKWKLLLITGVLIFIALVAVVASMAPLYSAETMLLLPSTPQTDLTERAQAPSVPQTDPFLIRSYIDVANNVTLCRTVIRQLDLSHNAEFAPSAGFLHRAATAVSGWLGRHTEATALSKESGEDRVLRLYRKRLIAANDERSLTLNLAFQAEDPVLAARIVNAHAAAYIAAQVDYRLQEAKIKTAWLNTQLLAAAGDVRSAQVALQLHSISAGNRGADAADQAADLKSLQAIATAKQNVYEALMSRYMLLAAEQQYGGSDVRIVSKADVPTLAKSPNVPLLVAVAAALSVLVGVVVALTTAYLGRPHDLDRIAGIIGLPPLGRVRIPYGRSLLITVGYKRRRAMFWEDVRALRHVLVRPGRDRAIIAVTAAERGTGASVMAVALARAIASTGKSTLLIDLDLKAPNVHNLLGIERKEHVGLGEVLTGADVNTAIAPAGCAGLLRLLSSSRHGKTNIDALAGPKIAELLQRLRSEFEFIILDTEPCGSSSDALGALRLADGTVLVATTRDLTSTVLSRLISTLRRSSVPLDGFAMIERGRSAPPRYGSSFASVDDDLALTEPFPVQGGRDRVPNGLPLRHITRAPDPPELAERS